MFIIKPELFFYQWSPFGISPWNHASLRTQSCHTVVMQIQLQTKQVQNGEPTAMHRGLGIGRHKIWYRDLVLTAVISYISGLFKQQITIENKHNIFARVAHKQYKQCTQQRTQIFFLTWQTCCHFWILIGQFVRNLFVQHHCSCCDCPNEWKVFFLLWLTSCDCLLD